MQILKDKKYFAKLLRLSLPLAIAGLLSFSLTTSSNLMVASLGNDAASAVYLGNQSFIILQFLALGIESTSLVLSSRALGEDNKERADKIFLISIISTLILSSLFFAIAAFAPKLIIGLLTDKSKLLESAAEYLRISSFSYIPFCISTVLATRVKSEKRVKIPFISALSALILNITFNFILIFGRLGIRGAAFSMVIARCAELSVLVIYVFITPKSKPRLRGILKGCLKELKEFYKFGAPIILSQAVWCINNLFAAGIMGRQREGALAATAAAMALYNLAFVFAGGLSSALGVLCARELGANEGDKIKKRLGDVQRLFLLVGVLTGALMQVLKLPFLSLWGIEGEGKRYAVEFINILSLFIIGTVYQSALLNGIIKSAGESRFVLLTEAFAVFVIIIPPTLLLDKLAPIPCLIFAALKSDQILKCPIAHIKARRMNFKL